MKAEPAGKAAGLIIFAGRFSVPAGWRQKIRRLFRRIQKSEKKRMKVNLIFIGGARMRGLNKNFRQKDIATDVLSFPLEQNGRKVEGEIYISYTKAKSQAPRFGNNLEGEILRLAAHGFLHLLGYDHHTPGEQKEMFAREEKYLKGFGAAGSGGVLC